MKHLINVPATSVWCKSNEAAIEHPLTATMPSGGIKKVRVSIEMMRQAGNITVRAGYQYSDDGKTWGSMVGIGPAALTSDTVDMGSEGWEDITSGAKRFIRFGILAVNAANPDVVNCAYAALRIETRSY